MTASTASPKRGGVAPAIRAGAPLPVRQRRPGYAALAVLLIVGLSAVGGWMYSQAGRKTPVVVVVHDVPAGHVITRADLSTVPVAGGITAIAGAHLDSVVGTTAAVHLLPDMLLQRSMVTAEDPLGGDQAQVGVAVKGGQLPADGLVPGDIVAVIRLPAVDAVASGTASDSAAVLVARASVFSAREDPAQAGGILVTLVVPKSSMTQVAAAGSSGLVALVRVRS